jgi:hypothetical protein
MAREIRPPDRSDGASKSAPLDGVETSTTSDHRTRQRWHRHKWRSFPRLEIDGKRYSHILDMRTRSAIDRSQSSHRRRPGLLYRESLNLLCILGPGRGQKLADKWTIAARWQRKPGKN